MTENVDHVFIPYIAAKRENLNLSDNYPALVIFDNFKARYTIAFLTNLDHNINVVLVPPNCTDRLQSLDVSVNKAVKNQLHTKFQHWHASQVQYASNFERDIRNLLT